MPHAERTVSIAASPEQAFAFFTDPANDKRWRTGVREIAASGPPAVGSKVRQVVVGPGGRGIAADIEITAYERPTRYAFTAVAGPVRPRGEYSFLPSDAGVSVHFALTAELGFLKGLLMNGQVQSTMNAEMANLDRAKAILEGR